MERRLKMMIAGSIAVWVPVASATQAQPRLVDLDKVYRLKADPAPEAQSPAAPDAG
ncbi:hypothetical protein M9978_15870 [Sphingomonas sp. MG17]|jgi:hypothetical protein|uniref:Uncharacterized protein n=1 Tax=Sphingomonas tagetis TaxID=2949092 RepID=A0A9X2HJB7_9SPHN|nr:hypothetical protein [Sphingomonas tagetis]MCP3731903.1 hypothetical protein [Sphingomonas tagetis]